MRSVTRIAAVEKALVMDADGTRVEIGMAVIIELPMNGRRTRLARPRQPRSVVESHWYGIDGICDFPGCTTLHIPPVRELKTVRELNVRLSEWQGHAQAKMLVPADVAAHADRLEAAGDRSEAKAWRRRAVAITKAMARAEALEASRPESEGRAS